MTQEESIETAKGSDDNPNNNNEPPYSSFSASQKVTIVIITALTGVLSTLTANIYFPALTVVKEDLSTTTEMVNLTVTLYMVMQGISPAFWGSLADLWGRRPVYLLTLFVYIGACVGLAKVSLLSVFLILRMLQAFGSSSVIAIGAGIIGDIATPAERGTYYGVFSTGQMLAPVLGPVVGGVITQTISWRWIFWLLTIIGAVLFTAIFFFLPETLRSLVGNGSDYANPTPSQWLHRRFGKSRVQKGLKSHDAAIHGATSHGRFLQFPNMMAPFFYVLQPDVAVSLLFIGLHYAVYYSFMTSTPSLFQDIYGLNELQIGLCFLSQGFGCICATLLEGRILDRDFRITALQNGFPTATKSGNLDTGFPIFSARLRSTWIHAVFMQAATIAYGWCMHYHLAVAIVLQTIVGFSVTAMYTAFQVLLIDLFPGKSASITASSNLIRCLLGAGATVAIEPGIQGIGIGWMFTTLGLLMMTTNVFLLILLHFGQQWRLKRQGA